MRNRCTPACFNPATIVRVASTNFVTCIRGRSVCADCGIGSLCRLGDAIEIEYIALTHHHAGQLDFRCIPDNGCHFVSA